MEGRATLRGLMALALSVMLAPAAFADTVTLEPNKDNTLFEEAAGALSNGAGSFLFTGRTLQVPGINLRRALLAFDITGNVPAGSTINSVTLTMNMSKTIAASTPVTLHKVTSDWGEGASAAGGQEGAGGASAVGDATWIHTFFNTSTWTTIGGDFVATASATQSVAFFGPYAWTDAGMAADVQDWLDNPGNNFGWLVLGDEVAAAPTAKRFDSRENAVPANRPQLEIDFTPPAQVPASSTWAQMALAFALCICGILVVIRGRQSVPA